MKPTYKYPTPFLLKFILVLDIHSKNFRRMLVYPYIQEHDTFWGLLVKVLIGSPTRFRIA